MPLQGTSGAASQDAFVGNGVAVVPTFIEDVFSCFLYTGNGTTQTITNGIDLAGKGGLVWVKTRTTNTGGGTYNNSNILADSARTPSNILRTNGTEAQDGSPSFSSFNSNGFTLGTSANTNNTGVNSVSWTFRKQPKFFDIVTWTGTGATGAISHSHSLGSEPGCIIIKAVSTNEGHWYVYHRSLGVAQVIALNLTAASSSAASPDAWTVSSTQFSVHTSQLGANTNGTTYVAYLFAHDAGGFGLTGTDNVISCGSFTTDGSGNATVSLGYEPQWLMVKASSAAQSWYIEDNMRAFNLTSRAILFPNLSNAEATGASAYLAPNSTGFAAVNGQLNASTTYIYIAIRRGPMKVPTLGTSVYNAIARTGTGANANVTGVGFPPDLIVQSMRAFTGDKNWLDRLRGLADLRSTTTGAEELLTANLDLTAFGIDGFSAGANNLTEINVSGRTEVYECFRRAPSFFDEVCYTGTGSARTVAHNLQAVPELMIVKRRNTNALWVVYNSTIGNTNYLSLNGGSGSSSDSGTFWNSTTPTSSVFSVNTGGQVNGSGSTFVAWLFATCAGVSKVGSYTGTATTNQIDCGFTAGARFVLIKRTDAYGDWYVWDTARGIVSGNDPYLLLNSTAAEVTSTDYIDTYSAGFEISSTAPADINASGGTYIFLAIA